MSIQKIESSIITLLQEISENRYSELCTKINISILSLINTNNYKNILIIKNSFFEPNIDIIIDYCLKRNIAVYIARHNKNNKPNHSRVYSSKFELELYRYTKQIKDTKEIFEKDVIFDLILSPILIFDKEMRCIDYEFHINKSFIDKFKSKNTIICAYCFSIQQYLDLSSQKNLIKADYIITDYKIYH